MTNITGAIYCIRKHCSLFSNAEKVPTYIEKYAQIDIKSCYPQQIPTKKVNITYIDTQKLFLNGGYTYML